MNPVHPGETIGDIFIRRGIKKGKTMSNENLPPGCSDKDVSDAGEATPATDDEVIAFIKRALPKARGVDIDLDFGETVIVGFEIDRGDIER